MYNNLVLFIQGNIIRNGSKVVGIDEVAKENGGEVGNECRYTIGEAKEKGN